MTEMLVERNGLFFSGNGEGSVSSSRRVVNLADTELTLSLGGPCPLSDPD